MEIIFSNRIYFSIFSILLLIQINSINAQHSTNSECLRMFSEANELTKIKDFSRALNKYSAAKTCDESLTQQVNEKILWVFWLIEKEKEEAITQRKRAEKLQKLAEKQRDQALKEAEANALATKAIQLKNYDPTSAFWHIQEAVELSSSPTILSIRSDILKEEVLYKDELKDHESTTTAINFSEDGELMITSGWSEYLFLWNQTGKLLRKIPGELERVKTSGFLTNKMIYRLGINGFQIWDLENESDTPILSYAPSRFTSIATHEQSNLVFLGDEKGLIRLYDWQNQLIFRANASK